MCGLSFGQREFRLCEEVFNGIITRKIVTNWSIKIEFVTWLQVNVFVGFHLLFFAISECSRIFKHANLLHYGLN